MDQLPCKFGKSGALVHRWRPQKSFVRKIAAAHPRFLTRLRFSKFCESAELLESHLNQGGPGSVRLRFGGGTVRAVPVFGSGGSSAKKGFSVFQYS